MECWNVCWMNPNNQARKNIYAQMVLFLIFCLYLDFNYPLPLRLLLYTYLSLHQWQLYWSLFIAPLNTS